MAAPTRDASEAGVAILRQEAGGGRVVVAGVHVKQAGGVQGAARERHLVEERIAAGRRHAELVVVVGLDDRAFPIHDVRDAPLDIVPIEDIYIVIILSSPSALSVASSNKIDGIVPFVHTRGALFIPLLQHLFRTKRIPVVPVPDPVASASLCPLAVAPPKESARHGSDQPLDT